MGTFRFGQAEPEPMLVPIDQLQLQRQLVQAQAALVAWKKANPEPPYNEYEQWRAWSDKRNNEHYPLVQKVQEIDQQIHEAESIWPKSSSRGRSEVEMQEALEEAQNAYKAEPTPWNRQRLNAAFYRYLYAGRRNFGEDEWATEINGTDYGYVATLLNPKADPLGRFLLCDARMRHDMRKCLMALSGTIEPLILGETHPDPYEECMDGYLRMHSANPGGARIKQFALGTTLYFGTMLGATLYRSYEGIYSMVGGCGSSRLADADKLWGDLVERGLAEEDESTGGGEEEYEEAVEVCAEADGVEVESSRGDTGYYTGEICRNRYVSFTGRNEGGEDVQTMRTSRLLNDPCIAYVCESENTATHLPPSHVSTWEQNNSTAPQTRANWGDVEEAHWHDDAPTPKFPSLRTVEMLTASSHGPSPRLVLFNAQAIKNSGHPQAEDLMVTYLTRPDIAPIVRGNQTAMELLGQQRLPGLSGLSLAAHREVMSAMRLGQSIDMNSDNPLRLPKKSAALIKLLAKYPKD